MKKYKLSFFFLALSLSFNLLGQSLLNGLIFYYPFNNSEKDFSGNQLHGSRFASYATDNLGNSNFALQFDGVDDYFLTPNDSSTKIQYPLTISFLVKHQNSSSPSYIINTDYAQNDLSGVWFNLLSGSNVISMSFGDTGFGTSSSGRRTYNGSIPLSPNVWYHVVGVINGPTQMELYINGVRDNNGYYGGSGNSTIGYSNNPGSVAVLDVSGQSPYYFMGFVDEYAYWDRALSSQEIAQLSQQFGRIFAKSLDFTYSGSGFSVNFINQSIIICSDTNQVYLWTFGDGDSSALRSPTHNYPSNGKYQVCLTISDSCGTQSFCDSISVCQSPLSYFTFSNSPTNYGQIQFTSKKDSINTGYIWDFGDGYSSTIPDPVHTYTSKGTYLVCLTTQTNGCGSNQYCDYLDLSTLNLDEKLHDDEVFIGSTDNKEYILLSSDVIRDVQIYTVDGRTHSNGRIHQINELKYSISPIPHQLNIIKVLVNEHWYFFKILGSE